MENRVSFISFNNIALYHDHALKKWMYPLTVLKASCKYEINNVTSDIMWAIWFLSII